MAEEKLQLNDMETDEAAADAVNGETAAVCAAEVNHGTIEATGKENGETESKSRKRTRQFIQILKFTAFSASAGVIQLLTTTTLHQWTGWLRDYYYIAYVIGLTLSVIWNFTFNRKFTFKAANNVPLAMGLVIIYNLIIVVPLAFGGDALVGLWGEKFGIAVTAITLLINFVTEFIWDKFVVFNAKVTERLERLFKKKSR